MNILIFALLCTLVILFICFYWNAKSKAGYNTNRKTVYQPVKYVKATSFPPRSCDCPELATWHGGQVQHKLKCPIFCGLNPSLTVKQFLEYEGFPTDKDQEWPSL